MCSGICALERGAIGRRFLTIIIRQFLAIYSAIIVVRAVIARLRRVERLESEPRHLIKRRPRRKRRGDVDNVHLRGDG